MRELLKVAFYKDYANPVDSLVAQHVVVCVVGFIIITIFSIWEAL